MKTIITVLFLAIGSMLLAQNANEILATNEMQEDTIIINIDDDISVTISFSDMETLEKFIDDDLENILDDIGGVIDTSGVDSITTITFEQDREVFKIRKISDGNSETIIKIDDEEIILKKKNFESIFYVDWGMNNYLENGKFPSSNGSQYSVKPWGSWSFDIGGGGRLWMADRHLSLSLGADFLWYNFKFQDPQTKVETNTITEQIEFSSDASIINPVKSKLTVNYLNVNLTPMVHIGKYHKSFDDRLFRIGVGAYAGYRINSYAKYVNRDNGDKTKEYNEVNSYFNDFRYGAKLVLGVGSVNIFGMYDFNTLFVDDKAPGLNPISFGLNFTI